MLLPILLILTGGLTWLAYVIFKKDTGADEDGDGGIPADWVPPDLDLPPGICLPGDGPEHSVPQEEELAYA